MGYEQPLKNDRHERYSQFKLIEDTRVAACIRAGYSRKTARNMASKLDARKDIQGRVTYLQNERAKRCEVEADQVLRELYNIAFADRNEVVSVRKVNCRYCFGGEHQFQWRTRLELDASIADWNALSVAKRKVVSKPEDAGGFGFNATRAPNPQCPMCDGRGHPVVHFADTRYLSDSGKSIYLGAKQGSNGIEVKLADRLKALDKLARHLGLYDKARKSDAKATNHLGAFIAKLTNRPGGSAAPICDD